jgi:uncharacterized protein (DUF1800 family)
MNFLLRCDKIKYVFSEGFVRHLAAHKNSRSLRSLFTLYIAAILLAGCGGGGVSAPQPQPQPQPPTVSSVFNSDVKTSRFLGKATFGATLTDINSLTGTEVSNWIKGEFNKPATHYLPVIITEIQALADGDRLPNRRISDHFFDAAISANDQLRQRVVLALSEIIVVSNGGQLGNNPATMAHYMDILSDQAFGNYRDLLEDITYSPAMGFYLTYIANQKGDPETGRVPDENYARELMQLFTLGLLELNLDGTHKLDDQGEPIEIFNNSDITGLAKVFTGLSYENNDFGQRGNDRSATYRPLVVFSAQHSQLEKAFLGTTIPANTNGRRSIDQALDAIFQHGNMAPFLSRQLIQRLTASSPSPAYVQRVSRSFEEGTFVLPDRSVVGTGERGDMQATIAAILLDADALQDPATAPAESGKIREPMVRIINWARAFNETTPNAHDERLLGNLSTIGQHPFRSPSVFNFFRPGFIAPGSETAAAGLTAPELQIMNESSSIAYINTINAFIYERANNYSDDPEGGVNPDYRGETAIAHDGAALINRLDLILTGGSLNAETRARILSMMDQVPVRAGTNDEAADRLARVRLTITMVMTAPGYLVQR